MVRRAVVCLLGWVVVSGCEVPPETALARAGLAPDKVQPAPAEDCGRGQGGDCAGEAASGASYQRVNVDGAPAAVYQRGRLTDSDRRAVEEALVTVAVFSDYECPFCARADATLAQVAKAYGDRVRVVMKHMPLERHRNARAAALAALAAGDQGRYWEMHEKLFAHARQLDMASLERYAAELGLDLPRFREGMASPEHQARVTRDLSEAAALDVRGTPAFFINGRKLVGAQPAARFEAAISEELRYAEALLASGVPRNQVYARRMEQLAAQ